MKRLLFATAITLASFFAITTHGERGPAPTSAVDQHLAGSAFPDSALEASFPVLQAVAVHRVELLSPAVRSSACEMIGAGTLEEAAGILADKILVEKVL